MFVVVVRPSNIEGHIRTVIHIRELYIKPSTIIKQLYIKQYYHNEQELDQTMI